MAQNLTAQQRAALFAQSTRQHLQMLPKQTAVLGEQVVFTLPKARLLSRIFLNVKASIKVTHASSTSLACEAFTPYKILRRVTLDLNNGFSPFVIAGKDLALYNMLNSNPDLLNATIKGANADANDVLNAKAALTASTSGTVNTVEFTLQLPTTLNQRDPYGLILLQNESTQVTLTADIITAFTEMFGTASGYTIALQSLEVIPMIETFSVPAIKEAFPDLSTLKLVSSKTEDFVGNGQNIVKMNVGTIYRKLMLYVTKADGTPFEHSDITSNIELVFNQADIPYSVNPRLLAAKNTDDYGQPLPKGVYVFDFSTQGVPNLGGSRDIIDTQKLTEFWVRFSSNEAGHISVISECLATLRA